MAATAGSMVVWNIAAVGIVVRTQPSSLRDHTASQRGEGTGGGLPAGSQNGAEPRNAELILVAVFAQNAQRQDIQP